MSSEFYYFLSQTPVAEDDSPKFVTGTNYYVSLGGADGNSGTSAGSPWQTDAKIRAKIGDNTIKAGVFFYTATGHAVPFATLSELGQKGVADAVIAGTISHSGDIINFLGVIPLTGHFAQSQAIGARVVNWGTAGGMDNSRTLANAGWTNPSGSIWKLLAPGGVTPAAGFVWEGNTQLTPVTGANFAAATAGLGAAGTFWVDPVTSDVYVHATAGGSPNSNGITYRQAQSWFATDAPLVDMSGGLMTATPASYGVVKYLGTYNSSNGALISLNIGASDGSKMTVIQRTNPDRWGKHAIELAGGSHDGNTSQSTGMFIVDDCHPSNAPTGFTPGAYSDFVLFLDLVGVVGKFYARINNCTDASNSTNALTSHNNGDTLQIRRIELTNNTFSGAAGCGAYECGHAVLTSNIFNGGVSLNAAGSTTSTGNTYNYRLPDTANNSSPVGSISFNGDTFSPGVVFASNCLLGGSGGTATVAADAACIWNLSGGNGNTAQWKRGGIVNLTLGGAVNAHATVPIVDIVTPASGDTVAMASANVYVAPGSRSTAPLTNAYAGGGALTWNTSSANGSFGVSWSSASTFLGAPVGTGNPANIYSGIITQAVAGTSTGVVFGSFDSTGLKVITLQLSMAAAVSGLTITDTVGGVSTGNVWTLRATAATGGALVKLYDCINPAVGANHVITVAGTTYLGCGALVAATKASGSPVFDGAVTAAPGGGAANAAALTPAVAGELFVTSTWGDVTSSTPYTVDSGYSRSCNIDDDGVNHYGLGAAYMTAGSKADSQPLWTSPGHAAGIIVGCYK